MHGINLWQNRRLSEAFVEAQAVLGERMYAAGIDDGELGARVSALSDYGRIGRLLLPEIPHSWRIVLDNDNLWLGKASLWSSIIGIVLPACLYVLVIIFFSYEGLAYGACQLLFVILQLVALGCGIAARRTPNGKAGLGISGSLLLLGFVFVSTFLVYVFFIADIH